MKTINGITLYDIGAEDMSVWVGDNFKHGFDIFIEDENGTPIANEEGVHPFAAESMAKFCRDYLTAYERAVERKERRIERE